MDKTSVRELIELLENRPLTPENAKELADLYIIYDHIKDKAD